MELIVRFGYGCNVPWVTRQPNGTLRIVAGPDMVVLRTPIETHVRTSRPSASSRFQPARRSPSINLYAIASDAAGARRSARDAGDDREIIRRGWTAKFNHDGPFEQIVTRSLITLKALTYAPTGGIVAAPTTSLPEWIGGVRNWDYRFCWLRDATLTLLAFMNAGYYEEAASWRAWLLRAVAGRPSRRKSCMESAASGGWSSGPCRGCRGFATRLRCGSATARTNQLQLDVFGEMMDALHQARRGGIGPADDGWAVQIAFLKHLETAWTDPTRASGRCAAGRRHFTYSKVMAWVAFDRAIKSAEE